MATNLNGLTAASPSVFNTGAADSVFFIEQGGNIDVNTISAQELLANTIQGATVEVGSLAALSPATAIAVSDALNMGGSKITNLGTPTVGTDAATKDYVDTHGGSGGSVSSVEGTAGQVLVSPTTGAPVVSLANTTVTPGSYTYANITVDAKGRLTAASSGTIPAFGTMALQNSNNVNITGGTVGGFTTINTSGSINAGQPITGTSLVVNGGGLYTNTIYGNSGTPLSIGSNASGISMVQNVDMGGNDFSNVSDIGMTGALATITNTGGTINIVGLGTSINSLGSCAINSANAAGFASSVEKVKFKDNTISAYTAADLVVQDVESISGGNGTAIQMSASNAVSVLANTINLGGATTIQGEIQRTDGTNTGQVYDSYFNPPPSAAQTLGEVLATGANGSNLSMTNINQISCTTAAVSGVCGAGTLQGPTIQATGGSGPSRVFDGLYNQAYLNLPSQTLGGNYTLTDNDIGQGFCYKFPSQSTGFVQIPATTTTTTKLGRCITIVNSPQSASGSVVQIQAIGAAPGTPLICQLGVAAACIIQYVLDPTLGPNTAVPMTIAKFNGSSLVNSTLEEVLAAGNTSGAYNIVMGDGTPANKGSITNMATADIGTLNVNILEPLAPLLDPNIGVVGNLVFDGIAGSGGISNITTLSGVNSNAIDVGSGLNFSGTQGTADIFGFNEIGNADSFRVSAANEVVLATNEPSASAGLTITPTEVQVGHDLNMQNNDITNCPTISALEAARLYTNSYYVNDGATVGYSDPQQAVNVIGADQGNVIYVGAGSYGGSTLVLSDFSNSAIMGPGTGGNPSVICELAGGRGLTLTSGTNRVRISNLQVEGTTTFAGTGNNYFQSVQMLDGLTVSAGTTGSLFMYDCEITGTITVPATFAGVLGFVRCNFTGATFNLQNASPAQVQFTQAAGLVQTYPLKAIYGGTNQLASGAVFEGVNSIIPVGAASFTTTGCASLGASLTYDSGTGALALVSQSGTSLSSVNIGGGGGGGANFFNYVAIVATTAPPIGNGHIEWNNATQQDATELYVSHLTSDGDDIDVFLTSIRQNDTLIVQDRNNSANYQKWTVSGTPTQVPNDYYGFPITLVESTVSFTGSQQIALIVLETRGVQSVSAGAGITVGGTDLNPVVSADVVDIQAGAGITVDNTSGTFTVSLTPGFPTLADVMNNGATAPVSLNMGGFDITNAVDITATTFNGTLNGNATSATNANFATTAGTATNAVSAGTAATADFATAAGTATTAGSATTADTATTAQFADVAGVLELNNQTGLVYQINEGGSSNQVQPIAPGTSGQFLGMGTFYPEYKDLPIPTIAQVIGSGSNAGGLDITNVGTITATTFVGALQGNADTATTATSAATATTADTATTAGASSNLLGSAGGLWYQSATNTSAQIPKGLPGQYLGINGSSNYAWSVPPTAPIPTLADVMTEGATASADLDMAGYNITNAGTIDGTVAVATNVGQSQGLIYNTTTDTSSAIANGSVGQVLTINSSGVPAWAAAGGGGGGGITTINAGAGIGVNIISASEVEIVNTGVITPETIEQVLQTGSNANGQSLGGLNTCTAGLFQGSFEGNLSGTASKASQVEGNTGILYNSALDNTARLAPGTSGQVLTQSGTVAPQWTNQSALSVGQASLATNKSGPAGSVLYQSALNTTSILDAGTVGDILTQGASAPAFASPSAITVGKATNVAQSEGILYNSGTDTSASLAPGTSNYILQTNGVGVAPSWVDPGTLTVSAAASATTATTATTATNIAGGAQNQILYQTAAGTTSTIAGPTAAGQLLVSGLSPFTPTWQSYTLPTQTLPFGGPGSLYFTNLTQTITTATQWVRANGTAGTGQPGIRVASNVPTIIVDVWFATSGTWTSGQYLTMRLTRSTTAAGTYTGIGNACIATLAPGLVNSGFCRIVAAGTGLGFVAGNTYYFGIECTTNNTQATNIGGTPLTAMIQVYG